MPPLSSKPSLWCSSEGVIPCLYGSIYRLKLNVCTHIAAYTASPLSDFDWPRPAINRNHIPVKILINIEKHRTLGPIAPRTPNFCCQNVNASTKRSSRLYRVSYGTDQARFSLSI